MKAFTAYLVWGALLLVLYGGGGFAGWWKGPSFFARLASGSSGSGGWGFGGGGFRGGK